MHGHWIFLRDSINLILVVVKYGIFKQQLNWISTSIAWENSPHFAIPSLVSRRNDLWETSAEIPYRWRVTTQIWIVPLIGWRKFSASQDYSYIMSPSKRQLKFFLFLFVVNIFFYVSAVIDWRVCIIDYRFTSGFRSTIDYNRWSAHYLVWVCIYHKTVLVCCVKRIGWLMI